MVDLVDLLRDLFHPQDSLSVMLEVETQYSAGLPPRYGVTFM